MQPRYAMQGDEVPFPINEGTVIDVNSTTGFFPIEMTPLYYGAPCNFSGFSKYKGGELMEPLAFNANISGPMPPPGALGPTKV